MTTQEHLKKIKAKCRTLSTLASIAETERAAYKSTIAAIDGFAAYEHSALTPKIERDYASLKLEEIIAAWPLELLS